MPPAIKELVEDVLFSMPGVYARFYRTRENWNLDKYLFLHLMRRGHVVVDGGANVGHYTYIFSKIAGAGGKVICFEPTPPTFQQLQEHIRSWGLANTQLEHKGLGDAAGEMEIQLPSGVSGYASLVEHAKTWGDAQIERFPVEIVRLDDFWKGEDRPLDFMKLDLEGAEPLAVDGAAGTLARCLPALHIELSPSFMQDFGRDAVDFLNKLGEIGYDAFLGFTDKVTAPVDLDALAQKEEQIPQGYTLVALNRAKHGQELRALARW